MSSHQKPATARFRGFAQRTRPGGCFVYFVGTDVRADRERRRYASANKTNVAMAREMANPHSADPSPPSGSNPKMRSIQLGIASVSASRTALTAPRAVSIRKRSDRRCVIVARLLVLAANCPSSELSGKATPAPDAMPKASGTVPYGDP